MTHGDQKCPTKKGGLREISVYDYKEICNTNLCPVLIDVREPWERDIATIPGDVSIPLGAMDGAMDGLDAGRTYVVYCHHGARSLRACGMMTARGFTHVLNLKGGIDAWSDMDPSVPRY